jgi:hypothetical protein
LGDKVIDKWWFQSNNMVALHSDLKKGSSKIKLVFIKKGWDLDFSPNQSLGQ